MAPALLLIGFSAVIAQIVLLRELMVVFCGGEISLGLALAAWLLWTAAGSALVGRLGAAARHPLWLTAALLALEAAALPAAIVAARASRPVLGMLPGEILGPGPMLLVCLATLGLFCLVSGGLFAAAGRLYSAVRGTSIAEAASTVYLFEAAGSGVGGLLASLVLIRYLSSLQIAALLALLNLAAAIALAVRSRRRRWLALALCLAAFLLGVFPVLAPWLEAASLERLWRGFRLIETRSSVYGNLALVNAGGTTSLFENGVASFNVPDPAAAEEAVHFGLLQHAAPESLLLIGGGLNGSLEQALRHPTVRRAEYVELDPAVLLLAARRLPAEWSAIRSDARVRLHHADGRLFMKSAAATFDVIIVNLPDPQTAQLNRFYTLEFFREAARRLTPTGVLAFHLTASENYISPQLAAFLRCLYKTLREAFPEVLAIPGPTVHFLAAVRPGTLTSDLEVLTARLRARRLETSYVREYYLPFRMSPDRVADLAIEIRPHPDTPVNRDFAPIAYYLDLALWSAQFRGGYGRFFAALAGLDFRLVAAALALALAPLLVLARRRSAPAGACVAAMGFTLIGFQILLLLAFQSLYGYVYHQLALLVAGFMAGLAVGSWLGLRRPGLPLPALQVLAALLPLLFSALLNPLAALTSRAGLFLATQVLFPALALLAGLVGGYQFPVASRLCRTASPGTLYALDLAGSSAGALLFGTFLIPVFGFSRTALLMALVSMAPALLVISSRRSDRRTPGP